MNCSVCGITIKPEECIKDTCSNCVDIQDWVGELENKVIKKPKIEKKVEKKIEKKVEKQISMIRCPKCGNHFSEINCSCGFRNPLFRK